MQNFKSQIKYRTIDYSVLKKFQYVPRILRWKLEISIMFREIILIILFMDTAKEI